MFLRVVKERLFEWRKIIFFNIFLSILIGFCFYLFIIPKKYQSEAKVFIPSVEQSLNAAPKFANIDNPSRMLGLGVIKGKDILLAELITSIMKSRRILEEVVIQCNLFEYFKINDRQIEKTVNSLRKLIKLKISKEGIITIRVRTTKPSLSAKIVNIIVSETDRFLKDTRLSTTQRTLDYISKRYADLSSLLIYAEDSLRNFCAHNGIVDTLFVANLVKLYYNFKFSLMAKEIKNIILKDHATEHSPIYKVNKDELVELQNQIKKMELLNTNFPSYSKLPELITRYNELNHRIRTYEGIYLYLITNFEVFQNYLPNNLLIINILDQAKPAEKSIEPEFLKIFILSILIPVIYSLLFLITITTFQRYFPQLKENVFQSKQVKFLLISSLILLVVYIQPFSNTVILLVSLMFIILIFLASLMAIPDYVYILFLFVIILSPAQSAVITYSLVLMMMLLFRIVDWIRKGEIPFNLQKLDLALFLYVISYIPGVIFVLNLRRYISGYLTIFAGVAAYILARAFITSQKRFKIMLYTFSFLGLFLTLLMLKNLLLSGFNILESAILRKVTDLPLGSTNYLAAFLNLFWPITLSLFLIEEKRSLKYVFLGAFILLLFCLLLTMSRGGMVCFLIGGLVFILLAVKRRFLFLSLFSALLITFILLNPLAEVYFLRFQSTVGVQALEGRFNMWRDAFQIFLSHPILGAGLNNVLTQIFPGIGTGDPDPHNFILKTAAEAGLIGLSTLVFLYWQIIRILVKIWDKMKISKKTKYLCSSFIICFVIAMVNQLFEPTFFGIQYNIIFWVIIGFICAFQTVIEKNGVLKNF